MAMVQIGVVHMPVLEPFMALPVGMRLRGRRSVSVLVMLVVDVPVFVLKRCVRMLMAVPFGQMKPEAERHKHTGADQLSSHRLAEQNDRDVNSSANAWSMTCARTRSPTPSGICRLNE